MPLDKHILLGIHITDRIKHVDSVQHALTEFGCSIKTRLGLHEADKEFCSPNGLLVLEMLDDDKASEDLMQKLNGIEGVEAKKIIFDHP